MHRANILREGHAHDTLLGDAMNILTPYGGRGVNVAMYAAQQLGLALAAVRNGNIDTVQDLEAAVEKYRQDVRKVLSLA